MAVIQIVLGSKSDLDTVKASGMFDVFDQVLPEHLQYSVSVCSAHRNSVELDEFVKKAISQNAKVFIGIAGMAAALPGAIAAASGMYFPVIGVPLDEHGIDSCIYMPPGVPVLTPGVGKTGLKNAAIAACQIMASGVHNEAFAVSFSDYLSKNTKQTEFDITP